METEFMDDNLHICQWNLLLDISSNYLSLQIFWNIIQTKEGVLETWIHSSCTKCGTLFKPKERFWMHGDKVHG